MVLGGLQDLLDAQQLNNYTEVTDMSTCRNSCGSTLHAFYSFKGYKFPNKVGKELTHISSFIRNTGFTEGIPERPKFIDPEVFFEGMVQPYTIEGVRILCPVGFTENFWHEVLSFFNFANWFAVEMKKCNSRQQFLILCLMFLLDDMLAPVSRLNSSING